MSRLDDIKAREAAATEGPWAYTGKERCGPDDSLVVYPVEEGGAIAYVQPLHADAAFIAHAREDIPWLVERIEAVLALHPALEVAPHMTDRPTTLNDDCTCPRVRHVHGTQSSYITCGCRCEPCVEAHRRAARDRRAHAGTKPAPKKRPSGRGTYDPSMDYTITLRPVADPATARHVGAIVVAHATDKADARRLLDALGLRELLGVAR